MSHTRITYRDFENAGQLARITEILESLRPMFPHWAETVAVERWDSVGGDNSTVLMIQPRPEYLNFALNVYNSFWTYPEKVQREKVIHELVHALHADVLNFDRNDLLGYIKGPNPDLYDYLYRAHTDRVEAFTQTMAFAFERMILATEAKAVIQTPEAVKGIREMAEGLMSERGAIGDGKPYTGVAAIHTKGTP